MEDKELKIEKNKNEEVVSTVLSKTQENKDSDEEWENYKVLHHQITQEVLGQNITTKRNGRFDSERINKTKKKTETE